MTFYNRVTHTRGRHVPTVIGFLLYDEACAAGARAPPAKRDRRENLHRSGCCRVVAVAVVVAHKSRIQHGVARAALAAGVRKIKKKEKREAPRRRPVHTRAITND